MLVGPCRRVPEPKPNHRPVRLESLPLRLIGLPVESSVAIPLDPTFFLTFIVVNDGQVHGAIDGGRRPIRKAPSPWRNTRISGTKRKERHSRISMETFPIVTSTPTRAPSCPTRRPSRTWMTSRSICWNTRETSLPRTSSDDYSPMPWAVHLISPMTGPSSSSPVLFRQMTTSWAPLLRRLSSVSFFK